MKLQLKVNPETGVIETHRDYWRHYRSASNVVTEKAPRDTTIELGTR